jgi:3-hydroxybutyryl-CoA dehydrogenase
MAEFEGVVGVVGAGAMGRGVAQVAAQGGLRTLLYDAQPGVAEKAKASIAEILGKLVERGRLPAPEREAALGRIEVAGGLQELAQADAVIEAIVENLEVKKKVFAELEAVCRPDAILASNTSSLRVAAIGAGCRRKSRIAGMHFFNPVPLMKLVEVVRAPATDEGVIERLVALGRRMGRVPVVVRDGPGFLVNLGGRAFTTEGLRLTHEGVATPAQVDAVMREACGFRMGPFELMDLTGIDVNFPASIAIWQGYFNDPRIATLPLHESLYVAGRFGRKTGMGHYEYRNGEKQADSPDHESAAAPAAKAALAEPDETLASLLRAAGAEVLEKDDGPSPIVAAPLGEDATTLAVRTGADARRLVAIDLTGDLARRITVMTAPGADLAMRDAVAARLAQGGARIAAINDSPGFIAQRIRAMIANLGCEIAQMRIASPADIDLAMTLGLNYPAGPLALADSMGLRRTLAILERMQAVTGEDRYRPSLWLRRRALLGLSAATPD